MDSDINQELVNMAPNQEGQISFDDQNDQAGEKDSKQSSPKRQQVPKSKNGKGKRTNSKLLADVVGEKVPNKKSKKSSVSKKKKNILDDHTESLVMSPVTVNPEDIKLIARNRRFNTNTTNNSEDTGIEADFQAAQVQVGEDNFSLQTTQTLEVSTAIKIAQLDTVRALKVRNISGEIRNITADVINDKVIIQGIVHLQIYFVLTDNIVHHQAEDISFSTFVDIPGAVPGMTAEVQPVIEAILYQLSLDGLSLEKKIVLEFFVKITESTQVTPELGAGTLLLLPRVVGEGTQQTLIENLLTLAFPALKITEIHGEVRDITVDVIPDKVIIQGIVHKQIFFVDLDNVARHQGEDVNFSLFIDLPGASSGQDVEVHPRIEEIIFELVSATELRQKVVLEVFAKVTENVQENVLVGNGPLFRVEQVIGERTKQILKESVVTLDQPAEKIHEINGVIRSINAQVIPDKVIIQGILHKQIFFIGPGAIEFHQGEDVPFSLFIDVPGAEPGQKAQVQTVIEEIIYHLDDPITLRQKAVIQATVIVTEAIQLHLVLTTGPLYKLMQVVSEGTKQIMITRRQPIPIPPNPPGADIRDLMIVLSDDANPTQQTLVENTIQLPEPAIRITGINGSVINLSAQVVANNEVLVDGVVNKEITFVNEDNIVKSISEQVPFSILFTVPGATSESLLTLNVDIEAILLALSSDGLQLHQVIVLVATVTIHNQGQPTTVVSDVSGEGIIEEAVRIIANLYDPTSGRVIPNQTLQIVTGVSGPQIASVEKSHMVLHLADDGLTPLDVVTKVVLRPVI